MSESFLELKQCVSFIFIEKNGEMIANGTGFFVGKQIKPDIDEFKVFFVTAKHVLKNGDSYFDKIFLRLNTKNGGSEMIPLETNKLNIKQHTENGVDIAIFECLPNQTIFEFKFLQDNLFATTAVIQEHKICEGDDIFFTGLFTSHIGQKKNQPIVRFGKVALISDEKIEWKDSANEPPKFLDLYLMECHSFGGNSGSPVFFSLNPMRNPGSIIVGGPNLFLAGIMTGTFQNGSPIQVKTQNTPIAFSVENIGIAAVTPAQKLFEILNANP